MKPTFVSRKVTLKFIPHNQWTTDIVWKYTPGLDEAREYAVEGLKMRFQQTVHDGSHYHTMLFYADKSFNNSKFHVQCTNLNDVTRSNTVKIRLHEIRPKCVNLVLLSPEIKYGTTVEIAYYPSDTSVEENGLHNALHTQPLNFFLDKVQKSSPYFDSTTGETDLKGIRAKQKSHYQRSIPLPLLIQMCMWTCLRHQCIRMPLTIWKVMR
ncbi:hypothetical protein MAR_021920 [Mya arenaria]|uniref:Uncharacterized protein n=1 Tax=Mya arenaria TaxID=6604 RepID=A0ABY7EHB5_MYAAR|nr:hypothetical protein MAR_021920 [Mya arenaria]